MATFYIWMAVAVITAAIAKAKGAEGSALRHAFFIGLVFSIFGLIFIAVMPAPPPKGMRSVKCRVCNTRQNVPRDSELVDCWKCNQQIVATR